MALVHFLIELVLMKSSQTEQKIKLSAKIFLQL